MRESYRQWRDRKYREVYKPAYDAFIQLYPFDPTDLPDEVWVPIPNYEDYQLSTFGRTKSTKNGKVTIIKPALSNNGYLSVTLSKDGKAKKFLVHRLVATLFIPNPELKPEVNHRDGNKFNNHVSNLEWATRTENVQHAVTTGLKVAAEGTDHHNALLTNEQVIYIRNNPDHLTTYRLAKMFHCKHQKISDIQLGKSYQNCGGQIREAQRHFLTPEQKAEARKLYVKGSREFGACPLARKYNCGETTIRRIVKKNAD